MKKNVLLTVLGLMLTAASAWPVQLGGYLNRNDAAWYLTPDAMVVAENVLLLQKSNGGWPKNYNRYFVPMSEQERGEAILSASAVTESTIDNNATYSELIFLANLFQAARKQPADAAVRLPANAAADDVTSTANDGVLRAAAKASAPFTYGDLVEVCRRAFLKGVDFVLSLQYPNGGFRQFSRDYGYYTHITYNDDAMVNVLYFIKAMQEGGSDADPNLFDGLVTDDLKSRLADAFDRGIQCILATQFVQNGVKTVWCAQHDENTLLPAQARSYELPSLSGAESVGIVRLLMEQPGPDARIREAVNAAMAWFDKTRITDKRVETFINEDGVSDRRLADRTPGTGSDIWGRFYELDTNRPFVCDRDGIVKYDMKDIGHERRNGYSWYTSSPERLFPLYDAWKKKWGIN